MGASVAVTSSLRNGFPDIVVGYKGENYLIEIKDGSKPPSQRELTEDEKKFHENWNGSVQIVCNIDDLITLTRGANAKPGNKTQKR